MDIGERHGRPLSPSSGYGSAMLELILLAVGLAMDATAAAAGLGASERSGRTVAIAAVLFGVFQSGMAGIGWAGGTVLAGVAATWDHWVAFVLLVGIGGHMLWEARHDEPEHAGATVRKGLVPLVGLAIATSIDALAAGITLPVLGVGWVVAIGTIGIVTAALSLAGGALGNRFGEHAGARMEILGGLVLMGIGVKVLVEHLVAGT
jgi:putative Mn2+ efflux pump MntP